MSLLQLETGKATLAEQMHLIRALEDRLQELCNAGTLTADLHMSKGQEAIAVGVCSVLRETDYVVCHHRMIAWALSKGIPLRAFVAELLGKEEGVCGGVAGEMHMRAMEYGFAHSFQLVGTVIPVAAGLAWAVKNYKRSDAIVVAVFGDAATANGQFHEGMNLAAVQQVPLLLVCENNHLAGNVRPKDYMPVDHVGQRAAGYGIVCMRVDGNDLDAVVEGARGAVNYVRRECKPVLLECDTTRLGKHKQGQGDIRTKEEMAALALRDPLRRFPIDPERAHHLKEEVETLISQILQEGG